MKILILFLIIFGIKLQSIQSKEVGSLQSLKKISIENNLPNGYRKSDFIFTLESYCPTCTSIYYIYEKINEAYLTKTRSFEVLLNFPDNEKIKKLLEKSYELKLQISSTEEGYPTTYIQRFEESNFSELTCYLDSDFFCGFQLNFTDEFMNHLINEPSGLAAKGPIFNFTLFLQKEGITPIKLNEDILHYALFSK